MAAKKARKPRRKAAPFFPEKGREEGQEESRRKEGAGEKDQAYAESGVYVAPMTPDANARRRRRQHADSAH